MSTNSTVLQHPPQSSISSLNSDPESEHADDENALGDPVNPGDVCDVIMIVDNREVRGMGPSRSDMQRLIAEATKLPVEFRTLEIGDVVFVARHRANPAREVVLDIIIERKTIDDLRSSLHSNRYERQKHFLQLSGLRRPLYLIEGCIGGDFEHLQKLLVRSCLSERISLRYTGSRLESARFLGSLHRGLHERWKAQTWEPTLIELPLYPTWSEQVRQRRRQTLAQLFLHQLMALRSMGPKRSLDFVAISGIQTPGALREVLRGNGTLGIVDLSGKLPPTTVCELRDLFTLETYPPQS
mmetsp:Transcript_16444/g.33541  ORF Transcript_16444/g.33541 Transcript_16444/m.33541 type:complete len:298 (-) Transcript_16444:1812-2705(-)